MRDEAPVIVLAPAMALDGVTTTLAGWTPRPDDLPMFVVAPHQ